MWRRIKNLWGLSNFEITEFDNKLVITKQEDKLVFARPKQAEIIKLNKVDVIDEINNG